MKDPISHLRKLPGEHNVAYRFFTETSYVSYLTKQNLYKLLYEYEGCIHYTLN